MAIVLMEEARVKQIMQFGQQCIGQILGTAALGTAVPPGLIGARTERAGLARASSRPCDARDPRERQPAAH
jgi:hypothetical protein